MSIGNKDDTTKPRTKTPESRTTTPQKKGSPKKAQQQQAKTNTPKNKSKNHSQTKVTAEQPASFYAMPDMSGPSPDQLPIPRLLLSRSPRAVSCPEIPSMASPETQSQPLQSMPNLMLNGSPLLSATSPEIQPQPRNSMPNLLLPQQAAAAPVEPPKAAAPSIWNMNRGDMLFTILQTQLQWVPAHTVGKITGMFLELSDEDILEIIGNPSKRQTMVAEALAVLQADGFQTGAATNSYDSGMDQGQTTSHQTPLTMAGLAF